LLSSKFVCNLPPKTRKEKQLKSSTFFELQSKRHKKITETQKIGVTKQNAKKFNTSFSASDF